MIKDIALKKAEVTEKSSGLETVKRQLKTAEDTLKKMADDEKAAKDKVIADKKKADEDKIKTLDAELKKKKTKDDAFDAAKVLYD